ncbi:MAG: ArsR/SmtB family transcription factor [Parvibaculaceae bacterium]|jgi:DNA-binding transcriptional ArsR family regulator
MKERQALDVFAALAQETRLRIVRQLVKAGPEGIAAGTIAERMGVSPSNVSYNLKELETAGLIQSRREARSIIYSADYDVLSELIGFLLKDCCCNHPDICGPALSNSCRPAKKRESVNA